jgi:hypothetical protein
MPALRAEKGNAPNLQGKNRISMPKVREKDPKKGDLWGTELDF